MSSGPGPPGSKGGDGHSHDHGYGRGCGPARWLRGWGPCDQDFLRNFARDTDVEALHEWFNGEVQRILRQHHAFDPEGIFICGGTWPLSRP